MFAKYFKRLAETALVPDMARRYHNLVVGGNWINKFNSILAAAVVTINQS